ncbi:MAG: alpha/beta hydrolase [Brachymonas sp.]|nr:alpha/beta hydrolase [Brachymonas sp.]
MTNAWIQRFLTVALLLVSWVGAVHLWPDNKVVAVWMASLPILITPLVLIQSFSMAAWANRRDSTPYASLAQWLCAWLAETKASLTIMHVWQPFRHQAIANHTLAKPADVAPQRGMVLVHGFFCNRAFWTDWMRQLRAEGRVFVSVDLEPAYGSITDYADTVEQAIAQVEQATGLPPVVVGHSMGGLAIRAWAARHERRSETMRRVHHIFTLGTPHQAQAWPRYPFQPTAYKCVKTARGLPTTPHNCLPISQNAALAFIPTATISFSQPAPLAFRERIIN